MIIENGPANLRTLKILKYVVVHDCGTVINPMILGRAKFTAASAQGIGNAFSTKKLVFDDQGTTVECVAG